MNAKLQNRLVLLTLTSILLSSFLTGLIIADSFQYPSYYTLLEQNNVLKKDLNEVSKSGYDLYRMFSVCEQDLAYCQEDLHYCMSNRTIIRTIESPAFK